MSSPRLSVAVCICAHLSMETDGHHNTISDYQPGGNAGTTDCFTNP